ncbi:MAG: HDOD domain-containing protein [Methylococcales bacterium]|jgi:HD-like signal output (HDOD) protein|nr:HDOD domain-containing protein [Methylococcales bacterium]MBT7444391.1 HDOD domain-containing protein [Methylococcales bacterium]
MDKWITRIHQGQFPIFHHSRQALKQIQKNANPTINDYRGVVLADPGLTISLIRDVNLRKKSKGDSIDTIGHASLLLGMNQVSKLGMRLPLIEKQTQSVSDGYRKAASKSYHSACQAFDWDNYLNHHESEDIFVAAHMRCVPEMGMWACGGSMQMTKIAQMVAQGHDQVAAEMEVLGFSLNSLGLKLAEKWHLSIDLKNSMNGQEKAFPKANALKLAGDFVNAVELGWNRPNVLKAIEGVSDFLSLDPDLTTDRLKSCAVSAAQKSTFYGVEHAAYRILRPGDELDESPAVADSDIPVLDNIAVEPKKKQVEIATLDTAKKVEKPIPQMPFDKTEDPEPKTLPSQAIADLAFLSSVTAKLIKAEKSGKVGVHDLIELVLQGAFQGIGMNRAFFAMLNQDKTSITIRFLVDEEEADAAQFLKKSFSLEKKDLFKLLMKKSQSVHIHDANRQKYWPLVPGSFKSMVQTDSFCASSIFAKGKPIGLFYADRYQLDSDVSPEDYASFKQLCTHATKCIRNLTG